MLGLHVYGDVVKWSFVVATRRRCTVVAVDENDGAVVGAGGGYHGQGEALAGDVVSQPLSVNGSRNCASQRRGVEQSGQPDAGQA